MKIKCSKTGVEKVVETNVISSHDLLQEGGYEYATKFYTVEDENDGELKWVTDEKEEFVLVSEYRDKGLKQHILIINDEYTNEFVNCDIWYEVK